MRPSRDELPSLSAMPPAQLEGRKAWFEKKLGGATRAAEIAECRLEIARTVAALSKARSAAPSLQHETSMAPPTHQRRRADHRGRPRSASKNIPLRTTQKILEAS